MKINLQLLWLYFLSILFYLTHFFNIENLIILDNIQLVSLTCIVVIITEFLFNRDNKIQNISSTIFCIVWLIVFLNFMVKIRYDYGFEITLLMFLSVWICDSFAFIIGSRYGKKEIFPKISPNKTWLGSIAGFIGVLAFNFILLKFNILYQENYNFTVFDVLNFSIIFGIIGQLGDFLESMIKRELNVKDSGTILQGHGGILDRMDSLILVAPCYYIYIKFIMGING